MTENVLVSAWEIVSKEKHIRYLKGMADGLSLEAWMELHKEARDRCSADTWRARYTSRANAFQYAHLYYILRRAG